VDSFSEGVRLQARLEARIFPTSAIGSSSDCPDKHPGGSQGSRAGVSFRIRTRLPCQF